LAAGLIRLQCYEGIDASAALYEWNYPRQMLAIRQAGDRDHRHLRRDLPDRASDARGVWRAPDFDGVLLIDEDRSLGSGVRGLPA